jgi:hypothetical protein
VSKQPTLAELYAERDRLRQCEADDGITEEEAIKVAEDFIPTIDQADSDVPPTASYRDWRPEDTKVVTYTNAPELYPRDRFAPTLAVARGDCGVTFGRILEVNAVPGRWFFRVMKQRPVNEVKA